MSGCLFLCAFHVLPPFAFDMSNCRGKTHCKSFSVLWVSWALGGRFLQWTCLPDLPSEWFCLAERAATRYISWVTDYHGRLTYSTVPLLCLFLSPVCCILVRFSVNQMSVWAKIPTPLNLALITLPPPLAPSPLQSASQSRCSSPAHPPAGGRIPPSAVSDWPHHAVYDTTTHEVHLYTISPPPPPPPEDVTWQG